MTPFKESKRAKILATLGPASSSLPVMKDLISAGVNAFRLNCSHARIEELAATVPTIRKAAESLGTSVSIVMDLQGPRLRVGRLRGGGPVELKRGARIRITTHDIAGTEREVSTTFKALPKAVSKGSHILLDDGSIALSVVKTAHDHVDCEIEVGGRLSEHKGINLPGADIDLPALSQKDIRDLKLGIDLGLSHAAMSFVRSPEDVERARRMLRQAGSKMHLIAKIEHPLAIQRIDQILAVSDGIMVARGDLAVELSPADVPAAQKQLVRAANDSGKICIVATQMLESMIFKPTPTRAEASDVANAIYDGADVLMLSGETAVGRYPVETVKTMAEIIRKAEASPFRYNRTPKNAIDTTQTGFAHALARATRDACETIGADAVIVYTMTGWSARVMSKYRPPAPIFGLTPLKSTYEQLALCWGVTPLISPLGKSTDAMIEMGQKNLMRDRLVRQGQTVLITAGGTAKHKASNMLKIHVIGSHTY